MKKNKKPREKFFTRLFDLRILAGIGAYMSKSVIMTKEEKQFWSIRKDRYQQVVETDSYIYRYYINPIRSNVGIFYDKLKDKWDTAWVKNGRIKTRNMPVNTSIHNLSF